MGVLAEVIVMDTLQSIDSILLDPSIFNDTNVTFKDLDDPFLIPENKYSLKTFITVSHIMKPTRSISLCLIGIYFVL
jgi:hypothetical protein